MLRSLLLLSLFSFLPFLAGCREIVQPGYVAVKVNNYGTNRGVEDYPVLTGAVWYNPFTTSVYEYPTFTQNATWQSTEKISFNTSDGSRVNVDVGASYTILADKVPHIFVKHRQTLDHITHNYLRNKVRDAINKHSAEYSTIDALGKKSQELLQKARKELCDDLEGDGFVIDTLSFISAPEPEDPSVKQSISQVINSTQLALQAENKVQQIKAEAEQEIAKAEGKAQSILLEAKAQAEANEILAKSLTPDLVRYKMIEVWDGKAPQVMGGDSQLLFNVGTK